MKIIVSEPVFNYLKPTIFFMRFFGLAPVSYTMVKKNYIIQKSMKFTIYSFIMAIVFSSMAIFGLVSDISSDSIRMKIKSRQFIVISDIGIVVWSVLFGVFMSSFKVRQLLNIIRCFNEINTEMNESTYHMRLEKRVAMTIGLTVYAIFISVFALDIYDWLGRFETTHEKLLYIKDYSGFYVLYLVVMTQELSFCNFTYYVKKRIMALNNALFREIQKKPELFIIKHKSVVSRKLTVDSKLLIGTEGDVLENYFLKNKLYSSVNELNEERVTSFLKVHSLIFTAVNSINDCFGYPVLFIMMSCLLHLVITPFFLITGPQRRTRFVVLQVIWMFVHLGRLLIIVEPTHKCLKEYEKLNPHIVHLLSKIDDKKVNQKLEIFAMQCHLCVVQFNPCGIVTIRRSILASIASAVTTYLVITIQLSK